MRRCAISIASNLAEGTARKTMKDKSHFTTMSYGSAIELLNQLILSFDLEFIDQHQYNQTRLQVEEITNKLNSLRNSQLNNSTNKQTNNSTNQQLNKPTTQQMNNSTNEQLNK